VNAQPINPSALRAASLHSLTRTAFGASAIGIKSLRENLLRTVLSMLGVIIGVAALVSVISLGDVMQGFVRGELERTTDLQMLVISAQTSMVVDGERVPLHNYPVFTQRDMNDLAATLPHIRGSAIQFTGQALVSWPKTGTHRNTVSMQSVPVSKPSDRPEWRQVDCFPPPKCRTTPT
jgi:putative ABC transport system permease protein